MTIVELKGSLEDFLKENKEQIDWVVLNYKWGPYYYVADSSLYGVYTTRRRSEEIRPLYHLFCSDQIDEEYSYIGDVEGALEFADSYQVWDEQILKLENGVLIGNGYEWNYQEDYNKKPEDIDGMEVINLEYCGLIYFDIQGKRRTYNGPIYRKNEEDGTYTKVGEI